MKLQDVQILQAIILIFVMTVSAQYLTMCRTLIMLKMKIKKLTCGRCKCKVDFFQEDLKETLNACGQGSNCQLAKHPNLHDAPPRYPSDLFEDVEYPLPLEIHIGSSKEFYVVEK